MKVLIADDEALARARLKRLLSAMDGVEVAGEATDGDEVLARVRQGGLDLVLLDIQMPKLTGTEAMALWPADGPLVVFCTAHAQHAVEAFETGAVDYLLKPIAADRLAQACARLRERLQGQGAAPDLEALVQRLAGRLQGGAEAPARLRWLSASVGDTIKMFAIDEVLFFQSDEKYTRVVTASDEAHVRKPLREIADGLDPELFWQVHRGAIVRASAIARAQRDELGRITLHLRQHGERLAVSQAYAWRFKPM